MAGGLFSGADVGCPLRDDPAELLGHNYTGHNYVGHNYIGHNYVYGLFLGADVGRRVRDDPAELLLRARAVRRGALRP